MPLRRSFQLLPRARIRTFSTTPVHRQSPQATPSTECSSTTCVCAGTPPGLDIDRKTPLLHTMTPYAEQVVICTGKEDWTSRIEDEESASGDFVRGLRGEIGRGGKGFDPFNNVLTTLSSFPASATPNTTNLLLFPSFKRINGIPHSKETYSAFASAYLKARTLHPAHAGLTPEQKAALTRDETLASRLPPAEPITTPTVLICGHGGRDQRCGILGPMLQSRFLSVFKEKGIDASVALISHIGGHKYAGNVIIYLPPPDAHKPSEQRTIEQGSKLAGWGLWYGRVGPDNVEGIVERTIIRRSVDLGFLRGGVTQKGEDIARMMDGLNDISEAQRELKLKPKARR